MTTSTVSIRPFASADQAAVRTLVLAGLQDHWGTLDPTLNPDLNDIADWYASLDGYTVVAEIDDQIVGTGTMHRADDQTGVLVRMSVSRDHRGRGIGKALVSALADRARLRGYSRLVCETTDTWQDAIALYRATGFTIIDQRNGDYHFEMQL
ncbi:MAG TPA: GNAT family N-acetyltransferase [Thermomicrobiales bacterium]|nr:GNAT family N-acetyltransferase [Thermomicrobiales bacterium]